MNETLDNAEREAEAYFAAERRRLRAPRDLWPRVEAAMADRGARPRLRWRAAAMSAVAAAAIALTLAVVIGRFGSGGPQSADEVLAGAMDALMDPESVGLTSYLGVAQFETETELGSLASSDTVMTTDMTVVEVSPDGTPLSQPTLVTAEAAEETVREVGRVQIAFKAPNRYRLELESMEPAIEAGERTLLVMDGDTLWMYDSRGNTYERLPVEELAMVQYYFHPGSFVGGADIGGLLQGFSSDPERTATLVGEETLLGRPVYVIEISPAYAGSTMEADGTAVEHSGGVVRMWLDQEFLFTLRMEMPQGPDGGTWKMRMTEIEFNGEVSDDLFRFEPPEGATEVAGDGTMGSSAVGSGSGGVQLPPGFLTPEYLPAGYDGVSVGTTSDGRGREIAAEFLLEERGGQGYIHVQERRRPDGMPDALMRGREVSIGSYEAWLDSASGEITLAWQEGDLVIHIVATGIGEDEVTRLAESMRLEEGPSGPAEEPGIATPVEQMVPAQPDGP